MESVVLDSTDKLVPFSKIWKFGRVPFPKIRQRNKHLIHKAYMNSLLSHAYRSRSCLARKKQFVAETNVSNREMKSCSLNSKK